MRHIRSFVLSLVLAPLIWALTGLGLVVQYGVGLDLPADRGRQVGLGALAAAGILVAVLALARLSPLGPALAGLGFLGAVAYAPSLRLMVPALPNGLDDALVLPADGYAVVLGIPLLATALSGRRWRRTAYPALQYAAMPAPVRDPAAAPAPTLVSPPAPTLVSPPPTLVSPAPTLVSPPAATYVASPAPTYVAPPAPTHVAPPAPTYVAPPAPTLGAPRDPWQCWAYPNGANVSPPPGYGAPGDTGPTSPWARPSEPSIDEETDDLSAALLPLRAGSRPHAR
ncbi:MAG TPA: hypothetical protein VHN18_20160 [Micromonosporaceae bacterium]|nr:hypothetical protein [Micromonosporaceae bacterium]